MKREEIEHLIWEDGVITESGEAIIIGSQSVLGAYPEALESIYRTNKLSRSNLELQILQRLQNSATLAWIWINIGNY